MLLRVTIGQWQVRTLQEEPQAEITRAALLQHMLQSFSYMSYYQIKEGDQEQAHKTHLRATSKASQECSAAWISALELQAFAVLTHPAYLSVACSVLPVVGEGDVATTGGLGAVSAVGVCPCRRLCRQQSQSASPTGDAGCWHHPQKHSARSA